MIVEGVKWWLRVLSGDIAYRRVTVVVEGGDGRGCQVPTVKW